MDLTSINSNYYSNITDAASQSLSATDKKDYSNSTDKELMDVCKQFEAYFIEQVLKEAEKTIPKSDEHDQSTENLVSFFKDNVIQEYAKIMQENQGGTGLAQTMFEQMKRNYGSKEIPTKAAGEMTDSD